MQAVLTEASHHDGSAHCNALLTAALDAGARDRVCAQDLVLKLVDEFYLEPQPQESFRFANPLFRLWWVRYGSGR